MLYDRGVQTSILSMYLERDIRQSISKKKQGILLCFFCVVGLLSVERLVPTFEIYRLSHAFCLLHEAII